MEKEDNKLEWQNLLEGKDVYELIKYLVEEGYVNELATDMNLDFSRMSVNELTYEESLKKLHGKYNSLSKEEENTIHKMASKF